MDAPGRLRNEPGRVIGPSWLNVVMVSQHDERGLPGDAGQPCPSLDAAAVAFADQYAPAIKWALNQACIPAHERADVRQEVLLRLVQKFRRHGPPGEGSHLSYVITIARNAALNHMRQRSAHLGRDLPEGVPEARSVELPPDEELIRTEGHERLRMAVAALTPLQRAVMEEALKGRSLHETADHYDWPYEQVRAVWHRARVRLRTMLTHR